MSDYTNTWFEVFVALFSFLPFFVLAYFYPMLPECVPLFLNLSGEVETWAETSVFSVFRVPLMAVDTQLVCLLMKYGTVQSVTVAPLEISSGQAEDRRQYVRLNVGIWDWFRCLIAFKMSASSLDTVFLSLEHLNFLSRSAFAITGIAAMLSMAGGLFYGYRLLVLKRKVGGNQGGAKLRKPVDERNVCGGVLYFNPSDSALFVDRYALNLANKWVWVLIVCIFAYPLLIFLPVSCVSRP